MTAELPTVERPVDADEGEEADEELQLEEDEKEPFAFEDDEHNGAERTEALEPPGRCVWRLRQCGEMAAYPLRLGGVWRQEGERLGPERTCAGDVARGFALLCLGGEVVDARCVNQRVAARTGACATAKWSATGGAVFRSCRREARLHR